MAVVVDISDSKHISYSPLNEKHNILYKNARRSFNKSYKHKPRFSLNPFTDTGVGKAEHCDRYDPTFDAGLQLLQSLVIVEDYFNEDPHITKEFKISEFWDFLFSGSWSNGYAVRVFEGQLLDMLSSCILSLTRAEKVIQHVTKAIANVNRQKYSKIKTSKKAGPELVHFVETLYLQFIYYGHTVQPVSFDIESSVYPDVSTTYSSCIHQITDSFSSENDAVPGIQAVFNKPPSPLPNEHPCQNPRMKRVRASVNAQVHTERERTLIARFLSNNSESIMPHPPLIPRGNSCRYTCSNFSNASDEYKTLPPRDNLNNFICTEKVSYLGEFNFPDVDSGTSSEDEDEDEDQDDFGQAFYLGEIDGPLRNEVTQTAEKKLKKRKEIVRQMRDAKKQELSTVKPGKSKIMPEFSELDVTKYVKDEERIKCNGVNENVRVPTLEEYADMLEAERREAKIKARNIWAKRSLILPGKSGRDFQVTAAQQNILWKVGETAERKMSLDELRRPNVKKRTNEIVVPLVYISASSGTTYLHPDRLELYLSDRMKMKEEEKQTLEEPQPIVKRQRMPLLSRTSTSLSYELHKRKFPKLKLIPSDIESDTSSDSSETDDDTEDTSFDTKKLNQQYSRDRLRKLKAIKMKKEQEEAKPHFTKILKKYFRVSPVLKDLSKLTKKLRNSENETGDIKGFVNIGKLKRKKKMTAPNTALGPYSENENVDVKEFVDIGKLKSFSFLEAKEKAKIQAAEPVSALFESYPMELFCENLERALKEFVVRREIIMSNNGKSLVSITFTKKSVFTTSKFSYK